MSTHTCVFVSVTATLTLSQETLFTGFWLAATGLGECCARLDSLENNIWLRSIRRYICAFCHISHMAHTTLRLTQLSQFLLVWLLVCFRSFVIHHRCFIGTVIQFKHKNKLFRMRKKSPYHMSYVGFVRVSQFETQLSQFLRSGPPVCFVSTALDSSCLFYPL